MQDFVILCEVLLIPLILEPTSNPQYKSRGTPLLQSNTGGCEVGIGLHATIPYNLEGKM